ncbi:HEAT repeat domain-containing protein [Kineosporia mesophila]|uniref:HEAT repeat domain-containing protein n=1 Tax=Kineosporia mesophila TaxID=566012 RepID=UPI001E2AF0A1|nr:hypothetical protein [Kineosporia mesophila]MCD5353177.1 hypothetical protein [Kineosporia mesophila]
MVTVLSSSTLVLDVIRSVASGDAGEMAATGRVLDRMDSRAWVALSRYCGYLDHTDHKLWVPAPAARERLRQPEVPVVAAAVLSRHPDGYVRQQATQVLAAMPGTSAVATALALALLDPVPQVRTAAADALLPRFDVTQHLSALRCLVEARRRRWAQSGTALNALLDLLFQQMTVPVLLETFDRIGSRSERRWAHSLARSLGELSPPQMVTIALSDHDAWLRRAGAGWLSEDRIAVPAGLLASPDPDVRWIVLQDADDLDASDLEPLLADPAPATRALACLHAQRLGLDLGEWYRTSLWAGDSQVRAACLEGLGRFGDTRDVPELRNHLAHGTRKVRLAAERSMAKILLRF